MASHKAFLGWFLFFGLTALGLHLAGFVYPGWISMRSHGEKVTVAMNNMMMTQRFEGQMIDQGGLPGPMGPMPPPNMEDDMMGEPGRHMNGRHPPPPPGMDGAPREGHGGRDHDHDGRRTRRQMEANRDGDMMMMEPKKKHEEFMLVEFLRTVTVNVEDFDVSIHYGLWFSKMCVHMQKPKGAMMEEDDVMAEEEMVDDDDVIMEKRDASSSSSSEDGHGRHGRHGKHKHCHCKKVSTRCALKMSFLFESPFVAPKNRLSADNIGHASLKEHQIETSIGLVLMIIGILEHFHIGNASLKEHQVETSIGLVLMIIGILGGIASFRKPAGCRCVKLATAVILLIAVALIAVPVVRITQYSHHRFYLNDGVEIRCPLSAILSSASCAMTFLAAFVTFVGMLAQNRMERPGRWYQFNNELTAEEEKKEKKGPALVFYNDDQYPVKAGLVDVCDFNDVKPEFDEPEKKPLE